MAAAVGVVATLIEAVSVVILRRHYPSDAAGGVVVALGCFLAALA